MSETKFKNKETSLLREQGSNVKATYADIAATACRSTGARGMTLGQIESMMDLKDMFEEKRDQKTITLDAEQTEFLKHCVSQAAFFSDNDQELEVLREFSKYVKTI